MQPPILLSLILTHPHSRTQPYRKVAINPEAQAGFQSKDHISKVKDAGREGNGQGPAWGGGAGKKNHLQKIKSK